MTSLNEFISSILADVKHSIGSHTLRDRLGLLRPRGISMPSVSNRETQARRVDTMRHAFK